MESDQEDTKLHEAVRIGDLDDVNEALTEGIAVRFA